MVAPPSRPRQELGDEFMAMGREQIRDYAQRVPIVVTGRRPELVARESTRRLRN